MTSDPIEQPRGFSLRDLALLTVVGMGAALFAELFRGAIHGIYHYAHRAGTVALVAGLPWGARVAAIAIACVLGAALARRAAKRGHGSVTHIADAVREGAHPMSIRAALLRALGALLTMCAGGSIGREGPIIQFGASVGQRAGTKTHDVRARELVAAGTAAGFAAAYNAPIAGAIFVIEVMAQLPARLTVARVGVATVAGAVTAHTLASDRPLYGAHVFNFERSAHLLAYGALGLLAGLLGVAFMKSVRAVKTQIATRGANKWAVSIVFGLVAGVLIASAPVTAGNGYDGITQSLATPPTVALALGLIAMKALATIATVSSGAPGGVFTPSMFLGAMLGIAMQRAITAVAPAMVASHESMAFVGMASMIAATTHAPLTAAVLAIELSGSAGLTIPLLLAVGLSSLVARRLDPENIYEIERGH